MNHPLDKGTGVVYSPAAKNRDDRQGVIIDAEQSAFGVLYTVRDAETGDSIQMGHGSIVRVRSRGENA